MLRDNDRTEVIVQVRLIRIYLALKRNFQESTAKVAYELDNTQIEFAAALENLDFERAVSFLEKSPDQNET